MKMAPEHWLCIKDDLVWAAAPGWQNGYGVLSYQLWVQAQHLFIMVNSTLLVILNYYKALKSMSYVVHQQNIV